MANMDAELKTLIQKRGAVKSRVTRFVHFITTVNNIEDLTQLILRQSKFDLCWKEFEEVQSRIDEIVGEDNAAAQETEKEAFENSFFSAQTAAAMCVKRLTPEPVIPPPPNGNGALRNDVEPTTQVKLPTINLPTFNGAYDQWLSFVDTFQSLIHDNAAISPIQKFHYLRSALVDEAAQVIHSLEMSSLNYDVAWGLLKERYENKRIIVQNHIKALFDLPAIAKESSTALRQLLDAVSRHLRALKSLEQPTDQWDSIMIHLITTKFDQLTKREWETIIDARELPTMAKMIQFLQHRCHLLESLKEPTNFVRVKQQFNSDQIKPRNNHKSVYSKPFEHTTSYVTSGKVECPKCRQSHSIYQCDIFLKLPVNDRIKEVKRLNLCLNCLRADHHIAQCNSSHCRICSRKHNTLLHIMPSTETETPRHAGIPSLPLTSSIKTGDHTQFGNTTLHQPNSAYLGIPKHIGSQALHVQKQQQTHANTHVLLSTAVITVYDRNSKPHLCRALLDSGSQSNFMTKELCQRLKLTCTSMNMPVTGINQTVTPITQVTTADIRSRFNAFNSRLSFLVLNQITERLPITDFDPSELKIPEHLRLADPEFHTSRTIDMLIGAEIFWDLLCVGQIRAGRNLPTLQKTHFGWIISGRLVTSRKTQSTIPKCYLSTQPALQEQLTKFWQLEETAHVRHLSKEEAACEEYFQETTTRVNGRFLVRLPKRTNAPALGESRQTATKRLYQMEKKLARNPTLREQYSTFMETYLDLGHMEPVVDPYHQLGNCQQFYLPHHAVFKQEGTAPKLRVVFDGSAATTTGTSLNEILMVGPTIQQDLFSITIRFRTHKYVITADIVKMYRQIQVHPDDTDLQRILWREDEGQPIATYRLNTVTYGTASAPFLATRCLQQLAQDEESDFPQAAPIVSRDFYVDDLLTGAPTLTDVYSLQRDISELLKRGGFTLHKWNSNCPELRETLLGPQPDQTSQLISDESVKTLGLHWNSTEDTLSYQANPQRPSERLTKRRILALISEIFDPLGLLGPLIISAKILIQQLWQLKIDWDETVPMSIHTAWLRYELDLHNIGMIKIPRRVIEGDQQTVVQLHGFCDASEAAYGAGIYLRSTVQEGDHITNLLCAKSRVAPLKTVSIPRLELCSALLLAQLAAKTTSVLNICIQSQHLWTDSTIALAWIESSPHLWKTFVGNRTSQIQELTNSATWHHVSTHENPADILSRGATMNDLQFDHIWWHGPEWLAQNEDLWTVPLFNTECKSPLPEARVASIALANTKYEPCHLFEKYSSLSKLVSVVAYCFRFINNCLASRESKHGALQVKERTIALTCLIKKCQGEVFGPEIEQLRNKQQVNSTSKLLTLSPFLDEDDVIRVGGRIQRAHVSPEQKHPIILPAKHRLTTLIISQVHIKNLHAGVLATLASVRLQYWPLTGRQTTKGIVRTCITCFKVKPTFSKPQMGSLPFFRANPSRLFSATGNDYCGPLHIREGGPRSRKTVKCYISIFVCFATKAVHLELVGNLTTEAFLGALKRFFGRRGKCTHIFSDNATNFVGANRELVILKELFSSELHRYRVTTFLAEEGVVWGFIPSNSPHFGGLWEAAVKSTKHHLRRVVGDASLSFEELSTVLVQIESCLNSRPLTPLSSDPNDLQCLTPGHFLIGDALTAYGEPSLTSFSINRLSRWQRVQQLTQHFWRRWNKEYLSQLQQRHKWNKPSGQLSIGTMVIIRDDKTPPLHWPLGRVTEIHPGRDGIVRVVTLRTKGGFLKRAVAKVCVLPIEQ